MKLVKGQLNSQMERLLFSLIIFFILLTITPVLGHKSLPNHILAQPPPSLSTQDGLTIEISSSDTSIQTLRLNTHDVSSTLSPSGFSIKNLSTQTKQRFRVSSTESAGNRVTQIANIKHRGLRLGISYIAHSNYIEIEGTLINLEKNDKAVILNYALPVEAIDWSWEKDILSQETIKQGKVYQTTQPLGDERRQVNRYPFSSISKVNFGGLSIAVPMDWPRVYRIQYDATQELFLISFDFGLTKKTAKFPNEASFKFIIYTHKPEWGFRAAAKKYYSIYPYLFFNRLKDQQGEWANTSTQFNSPQDFGIKYHEIDGKLEARREETIRYDDTQKILSFLYHMPAAINICLEPDLDNNDTCDCTSISESLADYRTIINEMSLKKSVKEKDFCNSDHRGYATVDEPYRTAFNSSVYDNQQRLYSIGVFQNPPYQNTRVFAVNPDPEITGGKGRRLLEGIRHELVFHKTMDGIYLDNLIPPYLSIENYRQEHFQTADFPLAFSYENGKPILIQIFSVYEFLKKLSDELHDRGKFLMGNLNPTGTKFYPETYLAHLLDVNGGEATYLWPASNVLSNKTFALHRVLSYQKPYTLLTYSPPNKQEREKLAKKALFYGIFPGNSIHPGGQRRNYLEEDRRFYSHFSLIIQETAKAGWEPITHAVTSRTLVERFGQWKNGKIYFTLRNDQNSIQQDKLIIDINALGISPEDKLSVTELFSANQLSYNFENSKLTIPFSIAAEDTIVLKIKGESTSIPGDANGDGRVDSEDFALLVKDYLGEPVHNTDFNGDGRVDSEDFAILQANYQKD